MDHRTTTIQPIVTYGGELWGLANITEKSKGSHLYNIYKDWEFEKKLILSSINIFWE
jgi:hypothetical protein